MLKESELKKIQEKIKYKFCNTKLLQQAFTRKSYASIYGGEDNEVLEFYGDRILDFAVVKDFHNQFGKINNKKELTSSKSVGTLCQQDINLIKNSNLAEQITRLGLTKYMQVQSPKEKTVLKNKADLFEAILGAIAIDSKWNINSIEKAYKAMMCSAQNQNTESDEIIDYIELFNTLIWKYQICKTENKYTKQGKYTECSTMVLINGKGCEIRGYAENEYKAKIEAYEYGYKILHLIYEKEFNSGDSYTEQLSFLYKFGLIAEPDYKFEYYPANSNYPDDFWRCKGCLTDSDVEYEAEGTAMNDAKEQVSYFLLCEALGIRNENIESDDENEESYTDSLVHGQGLLRLIMSMKQNSVSKVA